MTRSVADLLFAPRNIVVYGASSDPDKLSGRPLAYLKKFGGRRAVRGEPPARQSSKASLRTPAPPMSRPRGPRVIVVPGGQGADAIAQLRSRTRVGAATVFASGFSEAPEGVGVAAQRRITAIARQSGMRVSAPTASVRSR